MSQAAADIATAANPLIVRFAAFGDVVLLTTLIGALHQRYGRPIDLLSSGSWTAKLLAADPRVGHIELLGSRKSPYLISPEQWRAVRWLRGRGAGPVYACDTDDKSYWLLRHAGIDPAYIVRAQYAPNAGEVPHWCEWWLSRAALTPTAYEGQVPALDLSRAEAVPRLYVTVAERSELSAWLSGKGWASAPVVLIQAGNKRTLKRGRLATLSDNKYWPPERWAAVANGVLAQRPEAQVLLCGAPQEFALVEDIRRASGSPRVHNLAEQLPIGRLLALLERAHSLISVDTGPAHAAAALDCPLIVLFGSHEQRAWHPRSPSGNVRALGGQQGASSRLLDISVEEVLAAWRALPARASPPGSPGAAH
ncbi:MAG: glycosyltransferase family 9 protein [Steroidobacteraceae bacterium]|jgi:heptosyltransferase-2/heptosyltransferase-3